MTNLAVVFFAAAQIADVVTTLYALRRGAFEGNPMVAWLMARLGLGWVLAKLGIAFAAGYWLYLHGEDWALYPLALPFFAVSLNNLRVARRVARRTE